MKRETDMAKAEDLKQFKMHQDYVPIKGASLYVFTLEQINELLASQSRPAVLMPDKEISNDTVSQMQKDFMPVMDSHFKEGMYSGYAFGLQDGYKLALSQVQAIDGRELLIKFAEYLNENINEDEIDAFLRDNAT